MAPERGPQEAAPSPTPTPAAATARPGVVLAVIAGLFVLVVGGGFLFFSLFLGGGKGAPSGPNPHVVIDTSEGPITVELFQGKAPITVENFLKYVDAKHYDGTIWHRVMPDFMIQGGGFLPGMVEKGTRLDPITNESGSGLLNDRGTLAMARTNNPDSATDQFYINLVDNADLNRGPRNPAGYAVFGMVTDGMAVVDKIATVPTATRLGHEHVPIQDVFIKSIRRVPTK